MNKKDSGAKESDLIDLDIESFLDNKPIENGKIKADKFILGKSHYIPGFDKELEGHKEGEKLAFEIVAPNDYWQKDLRGKSVAFKVKINGVYERNLAELNDEFAMSLGASFKNIQDLKNSVTSGIKFEKQEKEKEKLRIKILEEISESAKIDVPKIFIERTLENMVNEVKQMAPRKDLKEDDLKKELADQSKKRVISSLVLHKISELEKLEPTEEEVLAQAKAGNLDIKDSYDYIYGILRNKKVFEFLEKQVVN